MNQHRLSIEHIREATEVIDPVFRNTPQFVSDSLSGVLGVRTVLKVETLNPVRSFKGRGVDYFLASLQGVTRVVTASTGNLGQAMAYGCRKRGIALTVFAGVDASGEKVARMRAFGAEVILRGRDFDEAKEEARRYGETAGVPFVEDGQEPRLSEGAGTIAEELLRCSEPITDVVVSLGNGAMLGGIARWVKAMSPQIRVLGVVPSGAPCMEHSWRQRSLVRTDEIRTIALGMATRSPIQAALEDLFDVVDDILLVEDSNMIAAMNLIHQHAGVVVEPSGAAGVAALLQHKKSFLGRTVAVVLCGGSLSADEAQRWLSST